MTWHLRALSLAVAASAVIGALPMATSCQTTPAAATSQVPRLEEGQLLRVYRTGFRRPVEGRLASIDSVELVLLRRSPSDRALGLQEIVPIGSITGVFVPHGRESAGHVLVWTLPLGLLSGLAYVAVSTPPFDNPGRSADFVKGALIGATLFTIVGSMFRRPVWVRVPLPETHQ